MRVGFHFQNKLGGALVMTVWGAWAAIGRRWGVVILPLQYFVRSFAQWERTPEVPLEQSAA